VVLEEGVEKEDPTDNAQVIENLSSQKSKKS
jgi:hypothetical protein